MSDRRSRDMRGNVTGPDGRGATGAPAGLVILCRMAADLVPIRLSVTAGDLYTLWAPRWRDSGDEWEGFLGEGDDLFGFPTIAELVAFVRSGAANDLDDHPAWEKMTKASAHKFDPADEQCFDLTLVEELLTEKPTPESVTTLANALAIVSSLGTVCDLAPVNKFFNGNPALTTVNAGFDEFSGRAGAKRWANIAVIVGRNWDGVLAAIEEIITTPDVDEAAAKRAEEELAEPAPEDEDDDELEAFGEGDDSDSDIAEAPIVAATSTVILGDDEDFWVKVGIDPIHVMTSGGNFYTLRCYLDERPIFLGRNGRISVFGSERALARYLADEHDHDLSDLSTYDDIRTAATDGSLDVEVVEENVYVLTGLVDDLADGPDTVDRNQLELVVELLRDVGDYAEEDTVDRALAEDRPLGRFVAYALEESTSKPPAPYADAVAEFESLERFLESRLRRE